jgi:hypothetical protein
MYDFSRQRMAARCFRCMLILVVLTIGWLVLKPPPSQAQTPGAVGRWSKLFRITPNNDWTGVHAALLRGRGDTSLVLHMLSARRRVCC